MVYMPFVSTTIIFGKAKSLCIENGQVFVDSDHSWTDNPVMTFARPQQK